MADYQRTLLEAVRVLHDRGYESLRAQPTVYATGHWRCSLGVVGTVWDADAVLFRYSSGQEWDYFRDGSTTPLKPEELADKLLPLVGAALAPCTPYRVWHSAALDFCRPSGVYWLIDEYFDWRTNGYVKLSHGSTPDATFPGFPLPPVF